MESIGKYWSDGAPYMGANPGIDPGQTQYWNDGAPFINMYQSLQTANLTKVAEVNWSSIGRIMEVDRDDILKILETETYI